MQLTHGDLRSRPLCPARLRTNTFSICLDHGITLASGSQSTVKFSCSLCAPTLGVPVVERAELLVDEILPHQPMRQGLLERDAGHTYLTADGVDEDLESPMNQLLGSSITYRIAVGPQQGRKVFTLQTLPDESDSMSSSSVAETAGSSLHAGVATKANERATKSRHPQASWDACADTLQDLQSP